MPYYHRSRWSNQRNITYKPESVDPAELAMIDEITNSVGFSGLPEDKKSFIASVKEQASKRKLSAAQLKYINIIKDSLVVGDTAWWNPADPVLVKKRKFTADYYRANGYYSSVVLKMDDPSWVPDAALWEKMWSNNFIQARWKRYDKGHKFDVGSIVTTSKAIWALLDGEYKQVDGIGLIQRVDFDYSKGQWLYEILTFATATSGGVHETEVKAIKVPKPPAVKKPRKNAKS